MEPRPPNPFDWRRLLRRGVDTWTEHSDPVSALVQMLMFPVLILLWTVAILIIASLV